MKDDWLRAEDVQEVLTRVNAEAVFPLHGGYREPESVALGLTSFLTVKDPHAKAVLDSLTIEHVLFFVSCGDTVLDPNFTRRMSVPVLLTWQCCRLNLFPGPEGRQ